MPDLRSILMREAFTEFDAFAAVDLSTQLLDDPRWPSGLTSVDDLNGGFCGLTVIAGPPKSAKSQAALRSAISAAATGWPVRYFDAENSPRELQIRLERLMEVDALPDAKLLGFRLTEIRGGKQCDMSWLAACAVEGLEQAERVLIVIDSLNTLAEELCAAANGTLGYFSAINQVIDWSRKARRLSSGRCAFILVSETNKLGGVKGQRAEYVADCVIKASPCGYNPARKMRRVELELLCRGGASMELGKHVVNWRIVGWTPDHDA